MSLLWFLDILLGLKVLKESLQGGIYEKGVVKNIVKFAQKHLCRSLSFNKIAAWKTTTSSTRDPVQVLSCEFQKILKKTFFINIWEPLLLKSRSFVGVSFHNARNRTEKYMSSKIPERLNKIIFWKYLRKQKFIQGPR